MHSKKKLTVAILALALVAVAAVTSVIAVLAATQTTVNNTFTITYTAAPNVVATVSADYAVPTLGTRPATAETPATVSTYAADGSFADVQDTSASGYAQTRTFSGYELSTAGGGASDDQEITRSITSKEINFNEGTGNSDATAYTHYVVLRFAFRNDSTNVNNRLAVTLNTTSSSVDDLTQGIGSGQNNVKVYYLCSNNGALPLNSKRSFSGSGEMMTTGTNAFTLANGTGNFNNIGLTGIQPDQTGYIYIAFVVDQFQNNVNLSNITINWELTASNSAS